MDLSTFSSKHTLRYIDILRWLMTYLVLSGRMDQFLVAERESVMTMM